MHDDEYGRVAEAIVEHLELCGYTIKPSKGISLTQYPSSRLPGE